MTYYSAGYTQTTTNQATRKAWDAMLHEQVQSKLAFKGLIGADKGGEGSLDSDVINKPIVQKTQLGKEAGDRITLSLVKAVPGGSSWYNTGKSGNTQLVDAEAGLTFHNAKVLIAHYRDAVVINGKMTEQRSPFDLKSVAKDRLADKLAQHIDRSTFWTFYAKYPPHVIRELGHATAVPTTHPNILYGKGKANLAAMDTTDVFDTDFLERVRVFVSVENIGGIMNEGNTNHIVMIHPLNGKTLRADSFWVDANSQGMERGKSNPIFQNATGQWAGLVVKESNDISTAIDFDGVTASNDVLTVGNETPPTGTAADYRIPIVLGANAIARAYGMTSYMAQRKEDDYGNISGFGGGMIYGDVRADWAANADNGTDGAAVNQSSALLYTYAPGLSLPTTW